MKTIRVRTPSRAHSVFVGTGLLARVGTLLAPDLPPDSCSKVFVFCDPAVAEAGRELLRGLKAAKYRAESIEVAGGEKLKRLSSLTPLFEELALRGADRHSLLIAVGGGAVGDAIGFVAGTFLRGVRWVGVPTTLLAQVDSSVGGKTAVNLDGKRVKGKNLVGVFHQPSAVLCDVSLLKTLEDRDRVSGFGEMIKYGLIYDPDLYRLLLAKYDAMATGRDTRSLARAVAACVGWKARAVTADERDERGIREVLNFGHTVGHALESLAGHGYFRHGEAVLLGMRAAAAISALRDHLELDSALAIDQALARVAVPRIPAAVTSRRVLAQLKKDKKARAGRVRFVLLKNVGRTVLDREVTDAQIRQALAVIGVGK